jgi:uncharacterized Zn finger protein
MTWDEIDDGAWFRVPLKKTWAMRCCDCGLVHRVTLAPTKKGKKVWMRVSQDQQQPTRERRTTFRQVRVK